MKRSLLSRSRRDPISRERAIALGRQALREIEEYPFETSESSMVFEDAFRELAPSSKMYLADYIRDGRGYSSEKLSIKHAIETLEAMPFEEVFQRVQLRVERAMNAAWKRGIISRQDEDRMPILKHLPQWVTAALQKAQRGHSLREIRASITEDGFGQGRFSYARKSPAVVRLGRRVAQILYEEGKQ